MNTADRIAQLERTIKKLDAENERLRDQLEKNLTIMSRCYTEYLHLQEENQSSSQSQQCLYAVDKWD